MNLWDWAWVGFFFFFIKVILVNINFGDHNLDLVRFRDILNLTEKYVWLRR